MKEKFVRTWRHTVGKPLTCIALTYVTFLASRPVTAEDLTMQTTISKCYIKNNMNVNNCKHISNHLYERQYSWIHQTCQRTLVYRYTWQEYWFVLCYHSETMLKDQCKSMNHHRVKYAVLTSLMQDLLKTKESCSSYIVFNIV